MPSEIETFAVLRFLGGGNSLISPASVLGLPLFLEGVFDIVIRPCVTLRLYSRR
ncbi:hypothetical protein TNCT_535741, partial [Trichonephila clavata]